MVEDNGRRKVERLTFDYAPMTAGMTNYSIGRTMTAIRTSRSAVETRQLCDHKRFLGYHRGGQGIVKRGTGYEKDFGIIVHEAMKNVLLPYVGPNRPEVMAPSYHPGQECVDLGELILVDYNGSTHMVEEQMWLLKFLVEGWQRYRLPHILRRYTILDVEREETVKFTGDKYLPANLAAIMTPFELPLRLDMRLERKLDKVMEIGDFKTARSAGEDWNVTLDNSNQSHLYTEGVEQLYSRYCGGIFYEGLVKGHRQMDNAKSSEFTGQVIQYGCPLYGWRDKKGECHPSYVNGRVRVFLPNALNWETIGQLFDWWNAETDTLAEYFPTTQSFRPLDSAAIVGQTIVNENRFQRDLDTYNALDEEHPEKELVKNVLFEKSLNSGCFKYGPNHKCEFSDICHGRMSEEEIVMQYEQRKDHHTDE